MKKYVFLALVLLSALSYAQSQDTSSLYNQAFNELDNLEQNSNQQETIIDSLLKSQSNEQLYLKSVEASLQAAEGQSRSLEVSLQYYKHQTRVLIVVVSILATVVIGESVLLVIQ